jgi:hypothetical protein
VFTEELFVLWDFRCGHQAPQLGVAHNQELLRPTLMPRTVGTIASGASHYEGIQNLLP